MHTTWGIIYGPQTIGVQRMAGEEEWKLVDSFTTRTSADASESSNSILQFSSKLDKIEKFRSASNKSSSINSKCFGTWPCLISYGKLSCEIGNQQATFSSPHSAREWIPAITNSRQIGPNSHKRARPSSSNNNKSQ